MVVNTSTTQGQSQGQTANDTNQSPLLQIHALGQSIWMDYIRRDMLKSGELKAKIVEDGLMGVTSNPAIFEKAIVDSHDYDDAIQALVKQGKDAGAIYEDLTVNDIQNAADLFRHIYDETNGVDGYVSLEVSPHFANDTDATLNEARHLWKIVNRPNLMVKVPGTEAGLPAIRQLISEGININVTLLFGLERYRAVAMAFIEGLEQRKANNQPVANIASVASFFLSRIDSVVDPQLKTISESGDANAALAKDAYGQTAIASAKIAYQIYKDLFKGDAFKSLAEQGAMPQRLLWASTSSKDPSFSDVKYVDSLIGPETVNTVPLETLKAYADHGKPTLSLEQDVDKARQILDELKTFNINMDTVTDQLIVEGTDKFVEPFDKLMKSLQDKLSAVAH